MTSHTTVAQVMTSNVVTVAAATPFKDITRVLAGRRVSAVPVVNEDMHERRELMAEARVNTAEWLDQRGLVDRYAQTLGL
jgi:CBS domain-containing protein